jgi:hypothetical protein
MMMAMLDDYLWDPKKSSGSADAEIVRLEERLGQFRAPDVNDRPLLESASIRVFPRKFSIAGFRAPLAIAAAAAMIITAGWITFRWSGRASEPWRVARLEGAPRVGSRAVGENLAFRSGQTLETDSVSRARIDVGDIGEVEVGPDSRVRLLQARRQDGSLALDQGTIQTLIWAPPRRFSVQTSSTVAVDLGCSYTLHVDPNGEGWMRVTFGWVAFQQNDHESFVPEGAMCLVHRGSGPGTPFYEDAPKEFQDALGSFDRTTYYQANLVDGYISRREFLQMALNHARPRDAITLWHLLSRTDVTDRARVFDRLAQLIPPPAGITREGILAGDPHMRDLWWDALGLRDTEWWREWKRDFPTK